MSSQGSWQGHDTDPNAAFWMGEADRRAASGSGHDGHGYYGQGSDFSAPADPYAAATTPNPPQDRWSQPFDGSPHTPMAPYVNPMMHPRARPDHPNAIPSIVLGVIGFVLPIVSPIGLVMAMRGRKDVRDHPGMYGDSSNLTAGLVLSAIGTALLALYVLMVVLLLVLAVTAT